MQEKTWNGFVGLGEVEEGFEAMAVVRNYVMWQKKVRHELHTVIDLAELGPDGGRLLTRVAGVFVQKVQ